jgi:glycolate oxidase FAD binding subunit
MTICCGAGTPVAEVDAALAEHGQCVAIPGSGTIGGALATGHSGIRRLGWGPVRDTVLQTHYVSAAGEVVKAGGPTVKNVSGFDLCRLLVGSRGTLGFLADVILRTRPLPVDERWYTSERDPWELLTALYRPTSMLWDGRTTWVLLDGHADDVAAQVQVGALTLLDGPPELPAHRWSMPPSELRTLADGDGRFVAEVGVGVVHHSRPAPARAVDPTVRSLHDRIKHEFDPTGRLNPGVDVLGGA